MKINNIRITSVSFDRDWGTFKFNLSSKMQAKDIGNSSFLFEGEMEIPSNCKDAELFLDKFRNKETVSIEIK